MKIREYLFEAITLEVFDKDTFDAIEGKEHMFFRKGEGVYHTIVQNGKNVGTVGFTNGRIDPFFTIGIIEEFRGKGILAKAYKLLASKHGFRRAYIDIENTNKKSIKAHKDFGFKPVIEKVDKKLYKTDVRMYKDF